MKNMVLVSTKIRCVKNMKNEKIYELAAIAIKDDKFNEKLSFKIIGNENYDKEHIFSNEELRNEFKEFLDKYNYPLVSYDAVAQRELLVKYKWINKSYSFYDISMHRVKKQEQDLIYCAMRNKIESLSNESCTASKEVENLYNVIREVKPDVLVPLHEHKKEHLTAIDEEIKVINDIFHGKIIVFSGKYANKYGHITKNKLIRMAKKCGAKADETVTRKTGLLVFAEGAGLKVEKAEKYGIKVMDANEFYEIVEKALSEKKNKRDMKEKYEQCRLF